jgi:hypothetical protein
MQEIEQLLAITKQLRDNPTYQGRKFSLDGKLVGDIGEVLAAEKYGLELLSENAYKHDAKEIATGRMVQIKASFKNNSYFPFGEDKVPDYFLAINILENGELEELFNGPGKYVFEHYIIKRNLKHYKETYYTLSKGVLKELNMQVQEEDKIKIVKL